MHLAILKALLAIVAALMGVHVDAPTPVAQPVPPSTATPTATKAYTEVRAAPPTLPLTSEEAAVLAGINAERAHVGLLPLVLDPTLVGIARTRASEAMESGQVVHVLADGSRPYAQLVEASGYVARWVGENLAMVKIDVPDQAAPSALAGWMRSPSHRDNILFDEYTRVGVGEVWRNADGRRAHYFATIFASD